MNRVRKGVALQVAARLIGLLLSLVTISIMTHYLGAQGYGILATSILFVGVFDAFTDFGVGTVIVRRVSSGRGDLRGLVSLNLGASLVYAFPLWLVMMAIGFFVYPGNTEVLTGIALVGVGLVLTSLSTCFEVPYEVEVKFGGYFWAELLSKAATLALVALVASADLGLTAMFVTQIVPPAIRLAVLFVGSRSQGPFRPRLAWSPMVALLKESLPLAAVHLIGTLYYRADGVLLSILSTPEQVGAYGLGYRLASNLTVISASFAIATLSVMSAAYATSLDQFRRVCEQSISFMIALAVPVAVLGPLMAGPVLALLAPDYLAELATEPTQWLLVATALGFINLIAAQLLVSAHRQTTLSQISAAALVLNVVLNLFLIPRLAASGAGISLALTEFMSSVVAFLVLRSATQTRWPWAFTARLMPPLGLGVLAWWMLRDLPLAIYLPAAGLAYVAAAITVGPVSRSDLMRLRPRPAENGRGAGSEEDHGAVPRE